MANQAPLRAAASFPASEQLKPYVPRLAIDWLRDEPELRHRQVDGSLAFVDISGFTNLTERLSKKGKVGAEEMNDLLDSTFTELLSVAYDFGAGVIKWGGDAVLLLFTDADHPLHACRAAAAMQRTMRAVGRLKTSSGLVTLRMSIGIHSGLFDFFHVGTLHRELIVTGPGATMTVATEASAEAGEILVSATTAAALEPASLGEQRGAAYLLKRAPTLERDRTAPVGDVGDVDLARCVPVAISSHLLEGGGEAEHRPLTVAFVHFGGTDELLAREGPEALADALEHCLDVVEGTALEYRVAFFDTDIAANGGKILLVSGAPSSTGRDEERMLRAVRTIADTPSELHLRIGVNRGRIFVGDFGPPYRRTYSFKGDAANLAARLMANAADGQILVTDDVLARSRTEFETAPLEPFRVKGKSEPVQAYALGAARGMRAHGARSPLVGRDEELRVLLEGLASARGHEGRIVEIVGDPGIGKSRLIEELAEETEPDAFISIQCEEYEGSTPYFAFDGLLRSLLAPAAADGEVTAARLRGRVKRFAPHLLPWLPLLGVPIGLELPDTPETAPLEGEFRKRRLHETVTELLGMLLLQPTVLAFEDVHWLDEASAGLLEHLACTVAMRPWLVVAARRDRPTTFRVPDDADPVHMHLEALDAGAAADLIERSSHELALAPQQVEELARRAGGNPLFLTELLAAAHRPEGLEHLPDSIEALMMREIDMLRPPARRMLRSASVIGASFALDLLKECLDESWEEATWKSLADFVQPQGSGTFRFRHMLARDSAYEGLPYRRRRELHARVGEVIEGRAGPDTDDEAALLSLHFFHAHRFEQAWRYSRTAGERAQAVYANVDAAALYERALAAGRHLAVAKGDLASVAEALGDVRDRAGDYRRAEGAYRQARQMHEGDLVDEARLLLKHAWIPQRLGRYSQALRWIGRAQRLLEGLPGEAAARQRAELHAWHAEINIHQGRFAEAILWCRRAADEAEPVGQKDALAFSYQLLDWAYMAMGMPDQATYSRRALALFEELGDVRGQSAVYNNLGMWAYFEGDWSEALELYGRTRDIRERMGDPIHVAVADENIAEILIDQGHLEEAERLLQSAMRVWRASGWRAEMATSTKLLGKVRSRSGRFYEALELLEEARTAYREVGAQSAVNETEAWMAECYLLQGNSEAALDLSTEALARAEAGGGFEVATLKRVRAYALLQPGRRSTAREALEESLEAGRARKVDYEVALSLEGLILLLEDDSLEAQALEEERDAILERLQIESPRALLPSLS